MLSNGRQSTRSPTGSQNGSYGEGPMSRPGGRAYERRSSMTEENEGGDNEYQQAVYDDEPKERDRPPPSGQDQYIAALQYRFPSRPKTDYAYSKPPGPLVPPAPPTPSTIRPTTTTTTTTPTTTPGSTSGARPGGYQSVLRPTTGGANATGASGNPPYLRPALRPVNPAQQNSYAKRIANETGTTGQSTTTTTTTPGATVRINEPGTGANISTLPYTRQAGGPGTRESTFESIHSQGGQVSYLGTGTFSQFENCLRSCLERERQQLGIASHITRHDIPSNIPTHDYIPGRVSVPPNISAHDYIHDRVSVPSHHLTDYSSVSAATLSLDDVRHINVALSRGGISLFPYHRPYYDSYCLPSQDLYHHDSHHYDSRSLSPLFNGPIHSTFPSSHGGRRIIGEVVSACRLVEEDQSLLSNRHGNQAVQNVWNAIQHHQPFSHTNSGRSSVLPRGPYNI